jgi:hypothetical protein
VRRILALIACASCTLPALDLAGRECPCADGYSCDPVSQRCVASDATPVGDAGGDAEGDTGGVVADASPESSSDDAPDDAASQDGGTVDAPPGPFCESLSPPATFCSDFDALDLPAGWTSAVAWGGAQLFIDNAAWRSAPRSVYFDVPALTGTSQAGTSLTYQFATPIQTGIDLDFDLLLEAMDTTSEVIVAEVDLIAPGAAKDYLRLAVKQGRTRFSEQAYPADGGAPSYGGGNLTQPVGPGAWLHVTWKLARTATTSSSSVAITLDDAGQSTNYSSTFMHEISAAPKLSVGLPDLAPPSGHWRARFDNVVVRLH